DVDSPQSHLRGSATRDRQRAWRRTPMRASRLVPAVLLIALGVAPAAQANGGGRGDHGRDRVDVDLIAAGLNSPRHLAFDGGGLYVAEAGRGGSGPCFNAGEGPACMGNSGSITKVDRWGRQYRVVTGLASLANTPNNDNAIGPHGITVVDGRVYLTNG